MQQFIAKEAGIITQAGLPEHARLELHACLRATHRQVMTISETAKSKSGDAVPAVL